MSKIDERTYLMLIKDSEWKTIYERMENDDVGSFGVENLPKEYENAIDYYIDNRVFFSTKIVKESQRVFSKYLRCLMLAEQENFYVISFIASFGFVISQRIIFKGVNLA
jgi:hypothetical protein